MEQDLLHLRSHSWCARAACSRYKRCLHLYKRCHRGLCCLPACPHEAACLCSQAARILANLIVAGAGVLLRAGAQAYRQALVSAPRCWSSYCALQGCVAVGSLDSERFVWVPGADAQKSGVTPESVKAAAKASGMTLEEAQKVLGVDRAASLQEVLKVSTLLRCILC